MDTRDMKITLRNDAVETFIHNADTCYYGDVDFNRGLRERLDKFVDKWGANPFWNFSYASRKLGLVMKKGVSEEMCLWGMGSKISLYCGEDGTIWWKYKMYGNGKTQSDWKVTPDMLWHIERRGLANKVIDLFDNLLTMFSTESDIKNMVMGAKYVADRVAKK